MAEREDTGATERESMVVDTGTPRGGADEDYNPSTINRIQYAAYLLVGFVLALVMENGFFGALQHMSFIRKGCEYLNHNHHQTELCYGHTAVYRVSFALCVFYFLHLLTVSDLTCCLEAKTRVALQTRFFGTKTTLLTLLFIVSFWVPNSFFAIYAWVCMGASAIFLLVQIMLIVDFAYQWNEDWGDRSERNSKWTWYLATIAIGGYLFGIILTVLNYIWYVPHSDCNLNAACVTIVLLGCVVYTMVAVWVPHGSIVPCAIVFAYTAVLCSSALKMGQDPYCNKIVTSQGEQSIRTVLLSAGFVGLTLTYSVISVGGDRGALSLDSDGNAENPDEDGHLSGYCFFYVIMMGGSMYLAMLVTDWSISGGSTEVNSSAASMWIKLATSWITIGLFLWSLLAPYFCCKHRSFGYDTSDW